MMDGSVAVSPEGLEDLRARARERDQVLELLRRTRADFENYQKRVRRERADERRYLHGPLALELLPVLDNLERATAAAAGVRDTDALVQGVGLMHAMFLDALGRHGITPIPAHGRPFDPHLHHAVARTTVPGRPANTVVQVTKQGDRIHDRVLRPAEVVVAVPPEESG
jgi:molecular chaperone GrpE